MKREAFIASDLNIAKVENNNEYVYTFEDHLSSEKEERSLDKQIGGKHYKSMKIQVVEFCHANKLDYMQGNAIKYICRFRDKGGKEDLEKAVHYIQILIDLEYPDK